MARTAVTKFCLVRFIGFSALEAGFKGFSAREGLTLRFGDVERILRRLKNTPPNVFPLAGFLTGFRIFPLQKRKCQMTTKSKLHSMSLSVFE